MSPKQDAYDVVTAKVIEALEQGTVPWHKPWRSVSGEGPTSLQTGKPYRGINVWTLSVTALLEGYGSPYWVTYKQAKERAVAAARAEGREIVEKAGRKGPYFVEVIDGVEELFRGGVRKGETGTQVVLWKPVRKGVENENGDREDRSYLILRYYTVFNTEQCDGVPEPEREELPERDPIAECESIVTGYFNGPKVSHGGNRAYYAPAFDRVQMPERGQFKSSEAYYGTLFHELAHSTGHESRLKRPELIGPTFGTENYSKEELVAELAAGFLRGEAGIELDVEQSAAYIASWLKRLKDDRKMLVQAAAQAQKASDRILGIELDVAKAA